MRLGVSMGDFEANRNVDYVVEVPTESGIIRSAGAKFTIQGVEITVAWSEVITGITNRYRDDNE